MAPVHPAWWEGKGGGVKGGGVKGGGVEGGVKGGGEGRRGREEG